MRESTVSSTEINRLTQTLVIICTLTLIYILIKKDKPEPQFHYVNFGINAQLVSATPHTLRLLPGQTIRFSVQWKFSAPLPESHLIAYHVRNQQHQLTPLDTQTIQASGLAYKDTPPQGIIFEDHLSIPTTTDMPEGIYEVVTFIYPTDKYPLNTALGSAIYDAQRVLFNVEIVK